MVVWLWDRIARMPGMVYHGSGQRGRGRGVSAIDIIPSYIITIAMMRLLILICAIWRVPSFDYTPEAILDRVVSLPGAEDLAISFEQFSGYLSIPGHKQRSKHIHYWLVESMNNPADDPLAFWTNGVS